jgi:hypothetical protein
MFSGCCGQPATGRTKKEPEEVLPENPPIKGGVPLLYLGAGRRNFGGSRTGFQYVVSDHRRSFTAHPDDVRALLRNRFVIQAP